MPRGARLTARQKAQQAVEKQEAKVAKLHERGKRLSAELHQVEADWRAESETLEYLRSHPALQGAVYDKGGVGAPEPIVRTGQIDEFIHTGPTTIGEGRGASAGEDPAEPFPYATEIAADGDLPFDGVALERVQEILRGIAPEKLSVSYVQEVVDKQNEIRNQEAIALERQQAEPKLTPNQVDPRDEPGEQIPPIKYDPPPKHEEDRERFVQADPFA